jgi:transposase
MLDSNTRIAILELSRRGMGPQAIARDLGISKNTVKAVLKSGSAVRPDYKRPEILEEQLLRITELHTICKGNLLRVHEILTGEGVKVAYSTLTGFCQRHQIGVPTKIPSGNYHFEAGEEMQHDTSPHRVEVGGRQRLLQCASVVLAYSRMIFAQVYPSFDRFHCKAFLTEAMIFFGGAARRCMVDNSNVVVAHGTGALATMAPEMVAFGQRFGFTFVAHEKGDANRSARVERPFDYIERNFYVGRTFTDLADLNLQFRDWCEKANQKPRKSLHTTPVALYAVERPSLQPLPAWIPPVVRIETRRVDVEGYVNLHTNRYPVPTELIDQQVEIHETLERVQVLHRHKVVADHLRLEPGARGRIPSPERRSFRAKPEVSREEAALLAAGPEFGPMMELLRRHHRGRACLPIRRLHRLFLEYPTQTLREAVARAAAHGLHDLSRIEHIILQQTAGNFFQLPISEDAS